MSEFLSSLTTALRRLGVRWLELNDVELTLLDNRRVPLRNARRDYLAATGHARQAILDRQVEEWSTLGTILVLDDVRPSTFAQRAPGKRSVVRVEAGYNAEAEVFSTAHHTAASTH